MEKFPSIKLDSISFVDDLGVDIARASLNKSTLQTTLKLNKSVFSDNNLFDSLMKKTHTGLSEKDGLLGYFKHEYIHFQEYYEVIKQNTVDGIIMMLFYMI